MVTIIITRHLDRELNTLTGNTYQDALPKKEPEKRSVAMIIVTDLALKLLPKAALQDLPM